MVCENGAKYEDVVHIQRDARSKYACLKQVCTPKVHVQKKMHEYACVYVMCMFLCGCILSQSSVSVKFKHERNAFFTLT
jgi:hypothetical protein